jgi:hypothetical protein
MQWWILDKMAQRQHEQPRRDGLELLLASGCRDGGVPDVVPDGELLVVGPHRAQRSSRVGAGPSNTATDPMCMGTLWCSA